MSEIIKKLKEYDVNVYAHDTYTSSDLIEEWGAKPQQEGVKYDAVILAVNHKEYFDFDEKHFKKLLRKNPVIVDIKNTFKTKFTNFKNVYYFSL